MRLGYGGGFYDRYLKQKENLHRTGIAFGEQIVKRIPTEIHDHPMDDVITETTMVSSETDNRRRMTMDAKLQELCRQAHEDRIRVGMLDTDTKKQNTRTGCGRAYGT